MIKLTIPKTIKITYKINTEKGLPKSSIRQALMVAEASKEVLSAINNWDYTQMINW